MIPSNKTGKLSSIRAGAIVHTVNGGMYRCTSKFATGGEVYVRLADLQGKPVPTPSDFRPISPSLARFAAWMRLAYNKDFDLYVKEYIKAAGLPIDPEMNWSKFFQARVAPKLMSKDEEVQDEAIHHIIISALGGLGEGTGARNRSLLGFKEAIKKFPQRIQDLPLEKQVTTFLMQTFNWRIQEANEYIQHIIFQNETHSMWTEGETEEDADTNLLDTEEHATGTQAYDMVESDSDVEAFRRGFEKFLSVVFRNKINGQVRVKTVNQFLAMFDAIYEHLKQGKLPKGSDLFERWQENTVAEGEKPLTFARFKQCFTMLPKLIDTYIAKDLGGEEVNPFIEIMQQLGRERKAQELSELQPVFGGLKLAEEFPINHDIEPDDNNSGSGSGGMGGSIPELGEAAGEASGEAAGAAGELAELAPLAVLAAQWEVPKCKGCGKSQDVRDCPACQEKFCGDCLLNHHANNPSHDRVASKKAAIPVDRSLNIHDLIADVIGSGLYESSEEPHFSHSGCDYCQSGGADVYDCKGYRNLADAQAPNREELEYDFKLCGECLYKLVYGEE